MDLTLLFRCAGDTRVFDLLDSVDAPVAVVGGVTADPDIEQELAKRYVPYAISPSGNLAVTTLNAFALCRTTKVLLIDSDCTLFPGAITRLYELSQSADIVRPTIHFRSNGISTWATSVVRQFEYTYGGYVYEPGLLIDLASVLPAIGGYLFTPWAPFTPDGELDTRVRNTSLRIVTDPEESLCHAPLPFAGQLRSHWRYGFSDALRHVHCRDGSIGRFLGGLIGRYRAAVTGPYHPATCGLVLLCDVVYLVSYALHLFSPRTRRYAPIKHGEVQTPKGQ